MTTTYPPKMTHGAKKYRDFYTMKPGAPIYMTEFGFYSMDRWMEEGHLSRDSHWGDWMKIFGWDDGGQYGLACLGWVTASFFPEFEQKVVENLGDWELAQDDVGRIVKYFKGRRNGFMPEYVDHPVKNMRTWEELCRWRMDPATPARVEQQNLSIKHALYNASELGLMTVANLVGGYMYLRSLIGPVDLLYVVHDQPELVHACMKTWFELADTFYAKAQKAGVNIDELFLAEDICYNHGLLISPDMVREFLFPYYQQLMANIRSRQPDKSVKLHLHVDTDGFCDMAIPLYRELGLNRMSPFEVASNCDVVRTAREYPDLLMHGGFDKRILAAGKDAIDREVDRILPAMQKRGGYYPTSDHGVPEEVSFENYAHFRKRLLEFA